MLHVHFASVSVSTRECCDDCKIGIGGPLVLIIEVICVGATAKYQHELLASACPLLDYGSKRCHSCARANHDQGSIRWEGHGAFLEPDWDNVLTRRCDGAESTRAETSDLPAKLSLKLCHCHCEVYLQKSITILDWSRGDTELARFLSANTLDEVFQWHLVRDLEVLKKLQTRSSLPYTVSKVL